MSKGSNIHFSSFFLNVKWITNSSLKTDRNALPYILVYKQIALVYGKYVSCFHSSLWTFNLDSDYGVCNITGCQWGYNHVFLSHIPLVFVSKATRLLTANGIALHLVCVWSRGDTAGDECGICAVSCEAEMPWKPSFICGRSVWNGGSESSDMLDPVYTSEPRPGSWQMLILH